MNAIHFSSATPEWATPQDFFDKWNVRYQFTLDVCADFTNAKCKRFFSKEDDGLSKSWAYERVWMNPPYGRTIGHWMRKAFEESKSSLVVCLVPARTDTNWWHEYAMKGEIIFIRGRLKFGGHQNSAPFPNAVVILGKAPDPAFT